MFKIYEVIDPAFVISVSNKVFMSFAIFRVLFVKGNEILAFFKIAHAALQIGKLFRNTSRFRPISLDSVSLRILDGIGGKPEAMVGLLGVVEQRIILLQLCLG